MKERCIAWSLVFVTIFGWCFALVTILTGCGGNTDIGKTGESYPADDAAAFDTSPEQEAQDADAASTDGATPDAVADALPIDGGASDAVMDAGHPILTVSDPGLLGGKTVLRDEKHVPVLALWLVPEGGAVDLTSLTIRRVGVGEIQDIARVELWDDSLTMLETQTLDPTTGEATFTSQKTLSAGDFLWVYCDFQVIMSHAGAQHAFEITAATYVGVDGDATVQGQFPIRGPTFIASAFGSVQVVVDLASTPSTGTFALGQQDVNLFGFTVTAMDFRSMYMARVRIVSTDGGRIVGAGGTYLLSNLRLMDGANNLIVGLNGTQDEMDISAAVEVAAGQTHEIHLRADVAATEDAPGDFVGHTYRAILGAADGATATNLDWADPYGVEQIDQQGELLGPLFTVTN